MQSEQIPLWDVNLSWFGMVWRLLTLINSEPPLANDV